MKKSIWDFYAPLYERFMKKDEKAYRLMYDLISQRIRGKVVLARLMKIGGIHFETKWTAEEYIDFLESQGFRVTHSQRLPSRITMLYTECLPSVALEG